MMKKNKSILLFGLILGLTAVVSAQDRKDIRDRGIISRTVKEYFIEEGLDEPLIESIEKYDEDGELVERQEFNKRGEVTRWEKYAYDEDRNMIEEVYLDGKGNVTRTEKTIYEDGIRIEKQYYNQRDKLYKKKVYEYEYSK